MPAAVACIDVPGCAARTLVANGFDQSRAAIHTDVYNRAFLYRTERAETKVLKGESNGAMPSGKVGRCVVPVGSARRCGRISKGINLFFRSPSLLV